MNFLMKEEIAAYKQEQEEELKNILNYWMRFAIDDENGGFFGKIDNNNSIYKEAPKGSVLNSRILWTFSAAFRHTKNAKYLTIAERAFNYIIQHFIDADEGGVYWSVDHKGQPLDTKKQIYALAFALYGLSEYVLATGSNEAKTHALALYHAIEKYSHDKINGGYIEALTKDWKEISDLRLSKKDANERKSMNTHLHVLEGYTNLYRIWPNNELKENILELVHLFLDHIIDKQSNHLILFFDDQWNKRSTIISFGHDIEAAWLVQEAAEVIGDEELIEKVKEASVKIADATKKGLDKDGGLWYEFDESTGHLIKEKHWWPQSEAMIGFLNAWQITAEEKYLQLSLNTWRFTQNHIIDKEKGEWFWGIKDDYTVMQGEDKAGLWKCPYHNSRACIELSRRLESVIN